MCALNPFQKYTGEEIHRMERSGQGGGEGTQRQGGGGGQKRGKGNGMGGGQKGVRGPGKKCILGAMLEIFIYTFLLFF